MTYKEYEEKEYEEKVLFRIKTLTTLYTPKCPAAMAIMNAAKQAQLAIGPTFRTCFHIGMHLADNKLPSRLDSAVRELESIAAELDGQVEIHERCRLADHEYYQELDRDYKKAAVSLNERSEAA